MSNTVKYVGRNIFTKKKISELDQKYKKYIASMGKYHSFQYIPKYLYIKKS